MQINFSGQRLFHNYLKQEGQRQAQEQRQSLIDRNYSEIYSHELAHKTAGGSYAGGIVIERNADGIPVGGHVSIKMPQLDKNNPQKTIDHANVVIRSAMAPSDPSDQDYKVANQARSIKAQAQAIKNKHQGNKLDIQA